MKKIKLAFITQFPIDISRPHGGVEAVSVNLIPSLSKYSEFDIHVVTLCASTQKATITNVGNVTIHRLPKPAGSELKNALGEGKRLIENKVTNLSPDLIHVHDTYGIMVNELLIPKVFTVHGFIYADTLLAKGKFKFLRSKIWEFIEKRSWSKQPNIISISPYVRERLSGVTKANIFDIDNPISDSFFKLNRKEVSGTIFTSSVLTPRKNPIQLVKAVALLVKKGINVQLRIAGSVVDEEYARLLDTTIKDNNLQDQVVLLGRINITQIQDELCKASIYALASLEENSPMGIEEAMAVGVPVVTSNRCGMPYMVKNGETGFLINPFDEKDIAAKCERILTNPELAKKMQEKSRQLALDLYHSDQVAARTVAVYHEILIHE
ncbi:glycosyltransferase family 4 protein [Psychromonas arctica]|uniref:glycosyltransferase family 4 protein n=1 Tax=Psychromonas arctica TaxID=168275 RepID=UPI0003F7499B|nr:glycosyltransferase family 4 protein [Psychromonas arctica]